jgi:adenine-specific DNA-methyltransferase
MSNALDVLIAKIPDAALRHALAYEVERLRSSKDFGLVFEKHVPESVRLYSHPIRRGLAVQMRVSEDSPIHVVEKVSSGIATLLDIEGKRTTQAIKDLVVVKRFGEPIFPGLRSVGRVERAADKPSHFVINAENFHAIETLIYAYEEQVDCIYIDPPYNTGAKDWKYNNDYVAADDAYRHSKWLSFMERRLTLAKRLLKPDDSVLILTIDEKEYLRIGLLLEQLFPTARIQMVSSVISPQGAARKNQFARTDEYVFFVAFGAAAPAPCALSRDWMGNIGSTVKGKLHWSGLRRTGTNAARRDRPNLFYPIYISTSSTKIVSVGEALARDADRKKLKPPKGSHVVWPIRSDGSEGNWQISPAALRIALEKGFVRLGRPNGQETAISYLKSGEQKKVQDGTFPVIGRRSDGSIQVDDAESDPEFVPGTQWAIPSHDASRHGSNLLRDLIPGRKFPFPKSLYAVEDSLRFFLRNKPDATVLDFFGGSGTTGHAVMRLNHQDGGRRRFILVTNNEVSEDEARDLRLAGYLPGDPEWEVQGIFQHITKPRLEAAASGKTHTGESIRGNYKFVDEFPMSAGLLENIEFMELIYLDRNEISRGSAFEAIAPLLWMKAGGMGRCIAQPTKTFSLPKQSTYGVLFDTAHWASFVESVRSRSDLTHLFIVTDSLAQYQAVAAELPTGIPVTMLYEDFLRNFELSGGVKL